MGRLGATSVASVTLLAALLFAVPAVDGATPKSGRFENRSQSKGLYLETTRHRVRTLWLFCRNHRYDGSIRPELSESRYETPRPLKIRRGGRFSYKGSAYRYGREGQPLGKWRMTVTGRFTSRTRVKITRKLNGCDKRTVTARRTRGL